MKIEVKDRRTVAAKEVRWRDRVELLVQPGERARNRAYRLTATSRSGTDRSR